MATAEEVKKLAALARISIADAELAQFIKEFDAIIAYVGQLERFAAAPARGELALKNVMREDGEPHAPGIYTEKLVAQFPAKKGNALEVKQIISHD